jgi:hypothetical protein
MEETFTTRPSNFKLPLKSNKCKLKNNFESIVIDIEHCSPIYYDWIMGWVEDVLRASTRPYRLIVRRATPGRRRRDDLWRYRPNLLLTYPQVLGIEMGTEKLRIAPACESEGLGLTWVWNGGNNILRLLEGVHWSASVMQSER